jgi:hypothetical protein
VSVSTHSSTSNANSNLTVPNQPIWGFNVRQYHQMIDIGILTADDPVEILEGWIIEKMPKNPPHGIANKLTRRKNQHIRNVKIIN